MVVEIEKPIGQIQKLRPFLPGKTQEELEQILAYGEEIKEEGARKKKKFWINCDDREDFLKLLNYKRKHQGKALGKYKYMDTIEGLEKEKFIEEYLYDDVLYSGKIEETEVEEKTYSYEDWKRGKVIMKEGVELDFSNKCLGSKGVKAIAKKIELKGGVFLNLHFNQIGDEGAEVISKMELKKGVRLNLDSNEIGDEGAKSIAENMKLKEGVELILSRNQIGSEGAKAIAEMELKEGVELDLANNNLGVEGAKAISHVGLKAGVSLSLAGDQIGSEGAKAIAKNMKLKEGVELSLGYNEIGDEGAKAIAGMELKEGVNIFLYDCGIGDDGAEAIMNKMKLKEGVTLHLQYNNISNEMKVKLREREKKNQDKGIKCMVAV